MPTTEELPKTEEPIDHEEFPTGRTSVVSIGATLLGGLAVRVMSNMDQLKDTPLHHWYVQLAVVVAFVAAAEAVDRLLVRRKGPK